MAEQKYTEDQYLEPEYFGPDGEISNESLKIVTTRAAHQCVSIYRGVHPIAIKSRAIRTTAIHVDDGRVSCYLCLDCAEDYLNEIHGN